MTTYPTIKDRVEQADAYAGWPDPVPLRDELPPLLPFPTSLMPSQLSGWAQDIAERMNCPLDLVAIPALISAGSLVGRRIGIRPQRRTDWMEVGNLWGCVVARPGSMKSPVASEALKPIRRLEAKAAEENQEALGKFNAAETLNKILRDGATQQAKKRLRNDGVEAAAACLAETAILDDRPPPRRYLTNDATAEKLGEICADNPNGVMVHRDELLSLFSDLDNPEKAAARGFFLTGWGGQDSYTFDRIIRGTVRVPAVNFSIFGTTQPSRLAGYIRESIRRFDDGMVQRLQLLAWPDFSGEYREVDRYPNTEARQLAFGCFQDLANLDARELGAQWDAFDGPLASPYLRFAEDAQEVFFDWRGDFERNKVGSDELSPSLIAHLSKYRGLVPRLALVCHLANNAFGPVSYTAVMQALGLAEYLETHARRAYASLSIDNAEAARSITRRVRKGDLPITFTARDIQRKGWSGLADKIRVAAGLEALLDADWHGSSIVETGGRPTTAYTPNPKGL